MSESTSADSPESAAPVALYRVYDEGGRLLYVGISRDILGRFQRRLCDPWRGSIASIDVVLYADRKLAARAETDAIRWEWPLWNIGQSPWSKVVEELKRRLGLDEFSPASPPSPYSDERIAEAARYSCHVDRLVRMALAEAWFDGVVAA